MSIVAWDPSFCPRVRSTQQRLAWQVALHEVAQLPRGHSVFEKRLNVFFRAKPEAVLQHIKDVEGIKGKQLETARRKFQAQKTQVEAGRANRREALAQLEEAGQRIPAGAGDTIWKGFGAGEEVRVEGLKQAAHYNGQTGVVERFDGERFVVRLKGKPKPVRIRPENLATLRSVPVAPRVVARS